MSLNSPWKRPENFAKEADKSTSLELLKDAADIQESEIQK